MCYSLNLDRGVHGMLIFCARKREARAQHWCCGLSHGGVSRKGLLCPPAEHFLGGTPFLSYMNDWQILVIPLRIYGRHLLKNEEMPVTLRKTTGSVCGQWWNRSFTVKKKLYGLWRIYLFSNTVNIYRYNPWDKSSLWASILLKSEHSLWWPAVFLSVGGLL